MSGVVKSIGKVFKKVASSAGKILPLALGAAAVLYTVGGALGVSGATGGWGSAASKLGSFFGEGSALSKIVGGAVTQAGYGAVAGAAVSAVSGGDPWKGAQLGALGGAVTGGVMGGMGKETDFLKGSFDTAPSSTATQIGAPTGTPGVPSVAAEPSANTLVGGINEKLGGAPATMSTASGGGGLFDKGGWIERNQQLAGGLIGGIGKGLLSSGGADKYEIAAQMQKEQADRIAANYRTGSSWAAPPVGTIRKTGTGVMEPTAQASGQLVWDAAAQKLVFVPATSVG
jgi:hypothetical protein